MASDENCANSLFLGWLREWYDEAKERGSKGATVYKHACDSLRVCPIAFDHPASLASLRGFGVKLCARLTEKLQQHCRENGLGMPQHPGLRKRAKAKNSGADDAAGEPAPPAKKKNAKAYVPAFRSGGYALVLGLSTLDPDGDEGMTKAELIEEAQPFCDTSFVAAPDPGKFYTAWQSMKLLVSKDLICERGRPWKRYSLTDEGWEVARRIRASESSSRQDAGAEAAQSSSRPGRPEVRPGRLEVPPGAAFPEQDGPSPDAAPPNSAFHAVLVSDASSLPLFDPIIIPAGAFTVHLVLDVREVRARNDRDYMQDELSKRGTRPMMRSLELGDACWVAKCHDASLLSRHGAEGDEVVLDCIVERKRLDDLISSIKDGRFHEQKFRLGRSGMHNVTYLVEEVALDADYLGKYHEAVESAMASTQVVNGYFVKKTRNTDESIRYLARMTRLLKKTHEAKQLRVIPTRVITAQNYLPLLAHLGAQSPSAKHHVTYAAFASLVSKSDILTLRDVYLKMLMCTRGITGDGAVEMQKHWPTPYHLVKAFEACGHDAAARRARLELVSSKTLGMHGRKKIAKAASQRIAEVWGDIETTR